VTISTLLVEDSVSLAETIMSYFELEGINCDYAPTGTQGLKLATTNPYDTILLDINLPNMNGLEVCTALRKNGSDIPILMLTARDTLTDKIAGFDAGADDYLVKPFEMRELVARVRSLSKRKSSQSQRLKVGPLKMDLSLRVATRDETPLRLTPTSWKLLELLMRAAPGVVSRDQMIQEIWQGEDIPNSEVLKVHLHKLRKQVDKPFSSNLIQTITSHGVRLRVNDD